MSTEEFAALARRLTYKPEVQIQVSSEDQRMVRVGLVREATDAEGKVKGTIAVVSGKVYAEIDISHWDEALALRNLIEQVRKFEEHEMREWLRIDGKVLIEPHPDRFEWMERQYRPVRAEETRQPARAGAFVDDYERH